MTEPDHHALVQAPIDPVDEDGLAAAVVGTVVSLVSVLLGWWQWAWLAAREAQWWLWVAVTSTGVGLLFVVYALNRRRRRAAPREHPEAVSRTARPRR